MKIFFVILTVVLLLMVYEENDDHKRKHLSWGFISAVIASAIVTIAGMF